MKSRKEELIHILNLQPHPEGGYFTETYRSEGSFKMDHDNFPNGRNYCTSIYYLLGSEDISRLHRIKSDEIWHHYEGSSLQIHIILKNGKYQVLRLGKSVTEGQKLQQMVTAGSWFGVTVDEPDSFALCGCTVSPGFDFKDFEMADREKMLQEFPFHSDIIKKLLP